MYHVVYNEKAKKKLKKIDVSARKKLKSWIEHNLEGCDNPRLHGKALTGKFGDLWRYRVGNYRILAKIHDNEVLIVIVDAGHRREIYR